jgi:SAM-dependent methyltransferase
MRVRLTTALVALSVALAAQELRPKGPLVFADVAPLLETLRPNLPAELRDATSAGRDSAWQEWLRARDVRIRARVARGEEDSLVNLWLFGTSFTGHPPVRERDLGSAPGAATLAQVAQARLDDLLDGLNSPGTNSRLRWARRFFDDRGIDPATPGGRARVRELLASVGRRIVSENAAYARALEQTNTGADPLTWMKPYASLYSERGLSIDTSLLSSFGIDAALEALGASGRMPAGSVRRVAVVGPGLDVINKADGHDFYPEQSIQPFALVDSLIRHRLARAGELSVTTLDVSARVNQHFGAARDRARNGEGYVVQLPLGDTERWTPDLVRYWESVGDRIGDVAPPAVPPRSAGGVKVRAVRVRPDVVLSVVPRDVNIVVERLQPLADGERFDLVVATNVFVYYDAFEQALALVNINGMLRPGGSLLSNQAVAPVPPMKPAIGHQHVTYSDRQFDHVFWYQRQ